MKKILFTLLCFSASLSGGMPEPYRSINDLPFDDHGWFGNQRPLGKIIKAKKPKVVIEVGAWLGCSTRFIATKIPPDAKVYTIDTWLGSPNESEHVNSPRLRCLYQQFLSNVKHAGLTNKIVPIRMESKEAAAALNLKADIIYLDAAHDTESVIADILNWYPHLNEGGVMCGDDWSWESVRNAVILCGKELNLKVIGKDNFWYFE